MAKLEIKESKQVVQEEGYVLELNKAEAEFIASVTRLIGGCPINSRRGIADNLRCALAALKIDGYVDDVNEPSHNGIYFNDTK